MKDNHKKVLKLLDNHGEKLHRLLTRLTMCENAAGDLIQELFIKLSESSGFGRAQNDYAYAWTCAANLARDWHRQRRINFCSLDPHILQSPDDNSSLNKMIRTEQVQQVLSEAMELPEPGRSVILMRYVDQQSYEQIAEDLDKNIDYVRSICSKSIGRLREKIATSKLHFSEEAQA